MHFIAPGILWHLAWAAPLMGLLLWYAWTRRARLLERLFGSRAGASAYVAVSKGARLARFALLLGAVALLAVAAARPSWGVQILPSTGSGRDVILVFDVSKSMLCKDVQPSRLEHAQWFARELVKRNLGDRFGVVAFAGTAFLECPLSSDRTSLLQVISELSPDSIPVGGTNVQAALESAMKAFNAAEGANRAIVLISDGDELSGDSSKAIAEAVKQRIPILVVGIGDPAQPSVIQVPDGKGSVKMLKDSSGEPVKSPLNERQLSELAIKTGGLYVRSTSSNAGLDEIQRRVKDLVPKEYDSGRQTRPIERFSYPLSAALVLLLIWLCVSERPLGRAAGASAKKLAAFASLFLSFSLLGADAGNEAAVKPEPPKASSQAKAPETPIALFNQAVDLQKDAKSPDKALPLYEKAINGSSDSELLSRSCQNLGVIEHSQARAEIGKALQDGLKKQDLDGAQKSLDQALKRLSGAEDLYRQGLKSSASPHQELQANQQLLLGDRSSAEEIKKRIEELKKQMREAEQKTRDAQKEQQRQNQQGPQQKNQQQGQQQGQQQQGQQQGQQQQGQQQSAQDKAQGAKSSVEELEKQAAQLGQQKLEQAAKDAGQEIEKALQAQKGDDGKSAERHLENAMKALAAQDQQKDSKDKDGKDSKDSKDGKGQQAKDQKDSKDKDGKDSKDKADRKLPDSQKDKGQAKDKANGAEKDEKEISPDQAASILDLMANDEKSLRDAIKDRQKQAYGTKPVDKDW